VGGVSIERATRHAELAVEASARAGDPELRCQALSILVLQRFLAGLADPGEEVEEALELERSLGRRLGEASWTKGHVLTWSGTDLDAARSFLEGHLTATCANDDLQEGHFLWWLTLVELRAGNWDMAERHAEQQIALHAQGGFMQPQLIAQGAAAAVAASRGDVERTHEISGAATDRAREIGMPAAEALQLWALGFVELSRGDARAAVAPLQRASDIWDELGYFEPGHRAELGDTVEALIGAGELGEAERRLAPWEEAARRLDRAWVVANIARCRGLLLAARGDPSGAFASFDEALAEHVRVLHPLDHGRTLLVLGVTQRRAKKRAAARASLEQALSVFERLGARLWADRARGELARIGGRTATRDELTEAERRIAALVAEGRSNREVAAALFLTEHSVETALTRIYRKLGVRSRTELGSRLRARAA
jgi:DNA-binding CsgD family transcriptional regulator